jgi:hypothetical protein
MSEVTQSIDTWSFGCVLSVAATWVVLGFQGVRQYETLRRLSSANKNTNDRFHNGVDVLPEVKKWHNYLRGHLRQSDTATPLVLDLIEHDMLQTETNNRLGMKTLCTRLDKLIKHANEDAANLENHTKTTDALVLKALLTLEEEAQALSSKPKTTPLRRRSKDGDGSDKPNSSEQDAALLPKDAAIRSTPLGQTTFRKEILENELQERAFVDTQHGPSHVPGHGGEFTESPIDSHPEELPQPEHGISHHLRPITGNQHHRRDKDKRSVTSSNVERHDVSWPSNGMPAAGPVQPLSDNPNQALDGASQTPSRDTTLLSYDTSSSASPPVQTDMLFKTPPESRSSHQPVRRLSHRVPQSSPEGFENLPLTNRTGDLTSQAGLQSPKSSAGGSSTVPSIIAPTPRLWYERPAPDHSGPSSSPLSPVSPSITVTPYPGHIASDIYEGAPLSGSHNSEKQVVAPEERGRINYDELPLRVYDLPYDICHVREEMDKEKPKGMMSQLKGMFKGEERKANMTLRKTYGKDREIVSLPRKIALARLTQDRS